MVALLVGAVSEIATAVRGIGLDVPRPPLWVAAAVLPLTAWRWGVPALFIALVACLALVAVWTALTRRRPAGQFMLAGVFIVLWAPFLLSFAAALLDEPLGHRMVAILLLMVVSNDTFGYIVGYRLGRTPIAPRISPKKSWEGLAGSLAGSVLVGVVAVPLRCGSRTCRVEGWIRSGAAPARCRPPARRTRGSPGGPSRRRGRAGRRTCP